MFINKTMHCTLQQYIAHLKEDGKDCTEGYMFRSRKGGQPLTISTITNMVKHWTKIVGMSGNYGAQSLRKTCGFHRWIDPGANHKSISKYFKHSAISVTKRYLCIKDDDGAKEKFTELGADPEQSDSTSQKPINPMISVNETGTIIYNNQWFKTESVKNYKLSGDLDYMSTVKMITKNISVMIRITDLTGKNKYVSPSHYKIMGYKPEDRLSKSCFDICHPDDIDTLLNALNVLADKLYTGDFYSNNMMPLYRARHAGGHYMWLQTVLDLIQDSQGKIRDVLHSSRVFTDHKVAEEFLAARQPANQYRPS
jgi:PAS domain S-box-containing protein